MLLTIFNNGFPLRLFIKAPLNDRLSGETYFVCVCSLMGSNYTNKQSLDAFIISTCFFLNSLCTYLLKAIALRERVLPSLGTKMFS